MKILLKILLPIFAFNISPVKGQDKCQCCTYYSIDKEDLYSFFFDKNIIRKNHFKKATIYTVETTNQNVLKFLQTKFIFDEWGNVLSKYEFSQNGNPHIIKEFSRNNIGQVIKTSRSYLQSDSPLIVDYTDEIVDFTYNQRKKLIKEKERGFDGAIIPDSQSSYSKYEYDVKDRLIKRYRYSNLSGEIYIYDETIEYPKQNESIGIVKYNGNNWLMTNSMFNDKSQLIGQTDYDYPDNNVMWKSSYTYIDNKLIGQVMKNGTGSTQCANNNNFTESYSYNQLGLLEKIIHKYDKVTCEMKINYE